MARGTVTIFSLGVYENGIVNRRSPLAVCDWLNTFPDGVNHIKILNETHPEGTAWGIYVVETDCSLTFPCCCCKRIVCVGCEEKAPIIISDWNNYEGLCADCHEILERIQDRRADSPDYTPEQRGKS